PVWQQYYHAFAVIPFFLREPDEPEEPLPFAPLVGALKETMDNTPDKGTIKAFAGKMRDRALAYASSLDDTALSQKNEGLSKRFGRDMTHAGTLALIGSHLQYHLGSCDAALRENGIPGVF
ncbi:MAG: DinB family protein, partial [Desulfovibrio sp.]|nr:DinB family protein [Desulfovibrio sp.]